ncbi:hypothetical protein Csa_004029 [Cucumis sativus]|uniref:Uncharacterized protein n=1 Tax=Cucumis sativus TaxID=3659 RepID=A0A0A0KGH4_CUCSA|nr:hypothetical protein Csa_004029 [Cucumis sativus]
MSGAVLRLEPFSLALPRTRWYSKTGWLSISFGSLFLLYYVHREKTRIVHSILRVLHINCQTFKIPALLTLLHSHSLNILFDVCGYFGLST